MNKDAIAIDRIKRASEIAQARGMGPLYVGYSGGKDSTVLADLAIRAGVPVEIAHSHTTIDAPETVYFVRREMARFEAIGGGKMHGIHAPIQGKARQHVDADPAKAHAANAGCEVLHIGAQTIPQRRTI